MTREFRIQSCLGKALHLANAIHRSAVADQWGDQHDGIMCKHESI